MDRTIAYFVSTEGSDSWSGKLPEPNADGTDGPLATIAGARDLLRRKKQAGSWEGPTTVWIRGGRYDTSEPIAFTDADSAPVTYAAYPGERPVIDGGRRITGWREEKWKDLSVWVTHLPELAAGKWRFRQLFVNGGRRLRPRWPKQGFFRMADVPSISLEHTSLFDGADCFRSVPGEMKLWHNINDVEVMVFHFWVDERMPITAYDEETGLVTCSRKSVFTLKQEVGNQFNEYYLENVFEALTEPGEWYADTVSGNVYYLPLPGEKLEEADIAAPAVEQLIVLRGDPEAGRYVEFLRFQGLEFVHTDWRQPDEGVISPDLIPDPELAGQPVARFACSPQAALFVPGVIAMKGARWCAVQGCTIKHAGYYAVDVGDGCFGVQLADNTMTDLGAGGVKINGSDAKGPLSRRTARIAVTDNRIHDCGKVFCGAVGIVSMHASDNILSHNHIHHLPYSGISCGWVWGYDDNVSCNNRIEKNHIHDLGFGWLSDMGGIYTLGVQPGTVIRGNLIHDIEKKIYGGWGIYLDEGSSYIVVENNICCNMSSQGFNHHFGKETLVRNNIFAYCREGSASLALPDPSGSFSVTFERNILLGTGQPAFVGGSRSKLEAGTCASDLNLFWDTSGRPFYCGNGNYDSQAKWVYSRVFDRNEWRRLGRDTHSLEADPCFADAEHYDFTLSAHSPALTIGFVPIDTADVGPRLPNKRDSLLVPELQG